MLVKCRTNELTQLENSEIRRHVQAHANVDQIELAVGECYQVFGIMFRSGIPWYLLCAEAEDTYPKPFCSAFFDIIDGLISPGWVLSLSNSNIGSVSIIPSQWANDERFLEKLVDGEQDAILVFNQIKFFEANYGKGG